MLPGLIWKVQGGRPTLYLTFDDGPIPEITPWVLDQLDSYGAKASFFCVGENVLKYPNLMERIKNEGHTIGNHTHKHISGWKNKTEDYLKDVEMANLNLGSKFFRPPYGQITPAQYNTLKEKYKIVMWDVLSGDFDPKRSGIECAQKVIKYSTPGSIVVFHDSIKAKPRIEEALPKVLSYFAERGFTFSNLEKILD